MTDDQAVPPPADAITAAHNAADIWAQHTLMGPQEIGYRHSMVNAALAAAAPAIAAQALADERERIREHILSRMRQLEPFGDKPTITELRILAEELGWTGGEVSGD